MSTRTLALASALAVTALSPVAAKPFYVPNLITASYATPTVATNPDEVLRQGGYSRPAAVQWKPAAPQEIVTTQTFVLPGVIGSAFRDRSVANSSDEVRQQGGFEGAAAVRWKPSTFKAATVGDL